jgi:uncharacterized protein (TIGR00369 family)
MEQAKSRSRIVTWEDPQTGLAASRQLNGLEYLQKIARGDLPAAPFARLLNVLFLEVSQGRAVFAIDPSEEHYNPIGTVHGGVTATLCDSAMGCAVHSLSPAGAGYTTLDIQVRYVRPILANTGRVTCVGTAVYAGRRIATAEARVTDASGNLYAHASTSCLLFPSESAKG